MAYDDGFYYGQCRLVCVVDNTADNGKTVLITTDDNKTYSGTIANKKCEFLLPPRTLYTVQKVASGSAEFTCKVEAGYGECIQVHLDTGYAEIMQKDLVDLDYIKAAEEANLLYKVPEAKAVKELNSSLVSDIYVGDDGKLHKVIGGADSVLPFNNGAKLIWTNESRGDIQNYTVSYDLSDYDAVAILVWFSASNANYQECKVCPKNATTKLYDIFYGFQKSRDITVSDTGVLIGKCNNSSSSTYPQRDVYPIKIYALKGITSLT